jgi:hypothetical protein
MNMNNVKFTVLRHSAGTLHTYEKKNLARETPDTLRFICWCTLIYLVEKFKNNLMKAQNELKS